MNISRRARREGRAKRRSAATAFVRERTYMLYRGDCLKILPELRAEIDLLLTDPPYKTYGGSPTFIRRKGDGHQTRTVGMPWGFSLDWIDAAAKLAPKQWVVFANYASLGALCAKLEAYAQISCIFSWRKPNFPPMVRPVPRLDCEFIVWARAKGQPCHRMGKFPSMVIDMPFLPAGVAASERIVDCKFGKAVHPCQKPVRLLLPFVERLTESTGVVLDPFMGLASTGVACAQLGRRFIGIDKDARFFRISTARLMSEEIDKLRLLWNKA